ncbi:PREDICTED: E3 ubiquitin-protein ligase ATL6-like [Fragaria vesca subsp. vesca]|uniref:E3 ubiquitin-protein ligase ATL6-like n=1 Tax=Fragaria vesca subsp. vesca TaxID=101020 RepID=UPI0002C2E047|nr:PREDICTED: E3 ubiquitin-protein ligase ATL6-like [Fragaria vesca subsp. vesca]
MAPYIGDPHSTFVDPSVVDKAAKASPLTWVYAILFLLALTLLLVLFVYSRNILRWILDKFCPARNGIEQSAITNLPLQSFSDLISRMEESAPEIECAICISEFSPEEMLRLLPNCNHAFHAHCIDIWLASHRTCPICRAICT